MAFYDDEAPYIPAPDAEMRFRDYLWLRWEQFKRWVLGE